MGARVGSGAGAHVVTGTERPTRRLDPAVSLYLDLIRVAAAIVVVMTHLAYPEIGGTRLGFWRHLGNNAVMIFFVLSGFVIAYVAEAKERTLRSYAVSRFARLWSVALPALLLTILFDQIGRQMAPTAYDAFWYADSWPGLRILAALTFTNELWFATIRPFSNGPFWSLGYEFWYYVLFAAATYFSGRRRRWLLAGLCLLIGPKILLLFPIWLLGVWTYRRTARPLAPDIGWVLFVSSIALLAALPLLGIQQALLAATKAALGAANVHDYLRFSNEFIASYLIGPLIAANFLGAHAIAGPLGRALMPLARPIRWIAQFTFTIYLVHYPVLRLIGSTVPYDRTSAWQVWTVFAVTLGFTIAVGSVIERRKRPLHARLDRMWGWCEQRLQRTAPSLARPPAGA